MPKKDFYDEMTEQSEVKTEIVRKYFWAWAKLIIAQVKKHGGNKIGYADLFAGKGRYRDGSKSTPLLILEGAIRDRDISQMLVTIFNDADPDNPPALENEIKNLPGINTLKYSPIPTLNIKVGDDLAQLFEERRTIPTLFFLDPWGYKGLSLRLVKAVLKPWGCDCIFFFNYNRINAALSNPVFTKNMNTFFGEDRANHIRSNLEGKNPAERQEVIIDELKEALKEFGGTYNLEYFFKDVSGEKTSHFLIFASKNVKGYEIMKDIMGRESSRADQGVPSFGFSPLDKQKAFNKEREPTLFDLTSPIDDLAELLLNEFAGRTLTTQEIYREHHLGKRFLLKNYQEALRKLEAEGKIQTDPLAEKRIRAGKVTFGAHVKVRFPPKKG